MPLLSLDEIVAAIDAVTLDDVSALAGELFAVERLSAAGVGGDEDAFRTALDAGEPRAGRGRRVINVAVSGAAGRMGQAVCDAVEGADDMALVGRADPQLDIHLQDVLGDADVVVDFSQPDTALQNARLCLEAGVHCVMGTTGADFSELAGVGSANLFFAPNFAIGAVLMMEVSKLIAPHMPECEIVELHHDKKLDAPSGTAARTAELIRRGRRQRARADPLGAPARAGGAPGGHLRRRGPDALAPARLDHARVVHAGGAAGGAQASASWTARRSSGSRSSCNA